MSSFRPIHTLHAHSKPITATRYSPSGHILATASADATVHLWDVSTRQVFHLRSLKGHTKGINDIAWNKDGTYLATASDDGTAIIWSIRTGKPLRTLRGHTSHVLCLAFNPKSNILATGGWDEAVILWNVQRGRKIKTLQAHSDPVASLGFNRDGTMVVTGSYDGLMRLWDATTGQCLKTIEDEQAAPISQAQFTPNGQYMLSSSLSSTIRLWDYRQARVIKTFTGHKGTRYGCGVVVMDANLGRGEDRDGERVDAEERDVKRRKIDTMDPISMDSTPITTESAVAPPPATAAAADSTDSAWIITGTDTEDIIIYDLQTRAILQRIHSRTFSLPEDERRNREQLRSGTTGNGNGVAEGLMVEKVDEGVKVDEREEQACLAVAGHPFRRELAVGGLGGDCVVRIWRDGA